MDFIDEEYRKNDELTANDLQRLLLKEFQIRMSISAVKRIRKRLGWIQTGPRYCQAIRANNCQKRLVFARECLEKGDTFDDVIY